VEAGVVTEMAGRRKLAISDQENWMIMPQTAGSERRAQLKERYWEEDAAWTGTGNGWFRGPRTLPLILGLLSQKDLTGGRDVASVYLELLARHMDAGVRALRSRVLQACQPSVELQTSETPTIVAAAQNQRAKEGAFSLARRRWQEGTVYLRRSKKLPDAWWGRFVETVEMESGTQCIQRNIRLGDARQLTKPLARRRVARVLIAPTSPTYWGAPSLRFVQGRVRCCR
jgi:hypothetical protein